MKKVFALVLLLLSTIASMAALKSPDGRLNVDTEQSGGKTMIVIRNNDGQLQLRVQLGLKLTLLGDTSTKEAPAASNSFGFSKPQLKKLSYSMLRGKQLKVKKQYTSSVLSFSDERGTDLNVELRIFNDGVAFRYVLPEEANRVFNDELTAFELPSTAHRWLQKYVTSYEGDFPYQAESGKKGEWGYPALFETNGLFILLTEANASRMYCATHLNNNTDANWYKVNYPQQWEGRGKGGVEPSWNGSWQSPWRVAIIGSLADVVESTLVDDVSDAASIPVSSKWIKPGRAAWLYWAYNHGTKDYKTCCQYVDLAKEMGWEYVLFDWEWDAMTNGGRLEDAVAYALSKGIKPWMWYNSGGDHTYVRATPLDRMLTHKNREEEFAWLKSLGVVGVKVDFFESDKQMMMNYYLDILDDAAKHQMMVNFHGCTLPRGWSRTYPHLMSQEAVYGAEQYNNSPYMTSNGSRINCLLPYTRNVVGPMDYTPVAFTNSQHPHKTSFTHELALSVAFESGVQHWADRPEGFLNLPPEAKQHMSDVPAVWDDTRFVTGYPGESFVVARRSGKTWYVAGICSDKSNTNDAKHPITLSVPLSFLGKGNYNMTAFTDGGKQEDIVINHSKVNSEKSLSIPCLSEGGFLLKIQK